MRGKSPWAICGSRAAPGALFFATDPRRAPTLGKVPLVKSDILLFCTLRNERVRLPFFLKYYRDLGINHFLIVDNDSDDGSANIWPEQPDVSLWWTSKHSYKRARFGVDWLNWLQMRHGHGHWCADGRSDEFLVYPFCDTRPMRRCDRLAGCKSIRSFGAMLLDMYPKGPIDAQPYREGQDPFEIACNGSTAATTPSSATPVRQPVDSGRTAGAHVLYRCAGKGPGAEQDAAGALAPQLCLCQFHPHAAAARPEPRL
jgi:hypothetical protein